MSLEKVGAENICDQHIQAWMRCEAPWTTQMSNALGKNASLGKCLVENKLANDGSKNAKRWSKRESFVSKVSAIQYVLKDGGRYWTHNVEITDEMRQPPEEIEELRRSKRRRQSEMETKKPFYERLMDVWRTSGEPRGHREIYEMIVDHCVMHKWNYCDGRSIYRMATYVQLRVNAPVAKAQLMKDYDEQKCC